MPRFTLDLKWATEEARDRFNRGEHLPIRAIARDFAERNGLNIISITDRPEGPLWVVEGEERHVTQVMAHFRTQRNVDGTSRMS
jgi:hypothetical protein